MPSVPTGDELIAWARGYLTGYARAEMDAHEPTYDDDPVYRERIRAGFRASERAARAKIWRAMVLAGETPTNDEIERRLWMLTAPTTQPERST